MKQTLLLFALTLIVREGIAQEINSAWFTTNPDSVSIKTLSFSSVDTSLTGDQVIWSFQSLAPVNSLTFVNGQSTDVPSGSLFPEANYVPYIIDNPISRFNFYSVTPAEINQLGSRIEESGFPTVGVYSNPKKFASFPITYGSAESDSFLVDLDAINGQLLYTQIGEHKLIVDGRGTLITPAGSFNDVIRLRSESRYIYSGIPPIPGGDNTGIERQFIWISPSLPGVILLSCQFILEAGFTNGYAYYANVTNLNTQSIAENFEAAIFPNPVTGILNIDHLNSSYEYNLSIFTTDGRLVYKDRIFSEVMYSFDVSDLNSGLYLLQLDDKFGKLTKRQLFVRE